MHVFIEESYRLRSCDMATPSPWPRWVGVCKKILETSKNWPQLRSHWGSITGPPKSLPAAWFLTSLEIWPPPLNVEPLNQEAFSYSSAKRTKTVQTTHRKAKWCKCRLCNKICDRSCTFGVDLFSKLENLLSKTLPNCQLKGAIGIDWILGHCGAITWLCAYIATCRKLRGPS